METKWRWQWTTPAGGALDEIPHLKVAHVWMVYPLLLFHRPSFHQLYIRELFSMHFISRAYFH